MTSPIIGRWVYPAALQVLRNKVVWRQLRAWDYVAVCIAQRDHSDYNRRAVMAIRTIRTSLEDMTLAMTLTSITTPEQNFDALYDLNPDLHLPSTYIAHQIMAVLNDNVFQHAIESWRAAYPDGYRELQARALAYEIAGL